MGIASAFKSLLGICATRPLSGDQWSVEGDRVRVKMATPLEKDAAVYLAGGGLKRPILLMRTEDDRYLAFENRCTHIGHRKLDPVPGKGKLRCCSVSHSVYDLDGNVKRGPAGQPIKKYAVEQADGELVISL